jgi:hypothetical protein
MTAAAAIHFLKTTPELQPGFSAAGGMELNG